MSDSTSWKLLPQCLHLINKQRLCHLTHKIRNSAKAIYFELYAAFFLGAKWFSMNQGVIQGLAFALTSILHTIHDHAHCSTFMQKYSPSGNIHERQKCLHIFFARSKGAKMSKKSLLTIYREAIFSLQSNDIYCLDSYHLQIFRA